MSDKDCDAEETNRRAPPAEDDGAAQFENVQAVQVMGQVVVSEEKTHGQSLSVEISWNEEEAVTVSDSPAVRATAKAEHPLKKKPFTSTALRESDPLLMSNSGAVKGVKAVTFVSAVNTTPAKDNVLLPVTENSE
jgi:hypothetical protein